MPMITVGRRRRHPPWASQSRFYDQFVASDASPLLAYLWLRYRLIDVALRAGSLDTHHLASGEP